MTALALRKRALLLESDLNRLALRAQCACLREAKSGLGFLKEARRCLTPGVVALAAIAGVALASSLRRGAWRGGFWARALAVAGPLIQLWRACVRPTSQPK